MTKAALDRVLLATVAILTGGCSAVDHPSLAPRAIERFTAQEPAAPVPPPVILPENASQQTRAAALGAQAREADARFRANLAEIRSIVANGAGTASGSEAWVQAQQALSRAEALREPISQSHSDLDALQIAAAEAGAGTETEIAIQSALGEVVAIESRQAKAMASLRSGLISP